nr:hypothetical protein [Mucilaginibacter sp. L294]
MAKYYTIDNGSIIIKPLAFMAPIGWALVALFLLMPITIVLIMLKGHVQEIEPKYFAYYFMMLPFLLACIPLFTYSRRKVIFDAYQQTIYLKTIFGQKALMTFTNVADIKCQTTFGQVYFIKSKDDRYGKGYRISPSFSGEKDKEKMVYDNTVLPEIYKLLSSAPATTVADNNKILLDAGHLSYYETTPAGYILKPASVLKFLPLIILFGLAIFYYWYQAFTKPAAAQSDKQVSVFLLIPIVLGLLTITKRVVFDTVQSKIKVYRIGFVFITYPITDLAGFNIVRKTHNGLYSGTDVRLKFIKPGRKQQRELTLIDFNKTNPIEPFINETEFIIAKTKSGGG